MIRIVRIISYIFLFCGPASLPAIAQGEHPSKNLTLFDHIEPISTAEAGGPHNSCWGYTAPNGREYAFLGTQIGTCVIDITEKPIRQVAFIPGAKSVWRNIKVYKHYAYISTENRGVGEGAGLQIVELGQLPDTAFLLRTDTTSFISAHTLWIADHYLYANGTQAEAKVNGGAVILDLEPDPVNPRRVGGVDPHYFHDCFVRNDTLVGAAIYGDGCDIYHIADKENPVRLGNITYPFSGTHNAELTEDGHYVITSDEVGFTPKTMKIWDISDLDDIAMVAEYTPNIGEIIHNVRIKGHYAFVAWYTAGARIVDIADPTHPREVAFYDTYLGESGGFDGAWEIYPHFSSGKIVTSDRNSGLYVLQFNGATAGSISGVMRDAQTNQPITNGTIKVAEYKKSIGSNATGTYYVGGVNGDEITVDASAFGYRDALFTTTLAGDEVRDILLEPVSFKTIAIRARDLSTGLPVANFSYTIDPYIQSATADGETATVSLPIEKDFTLILGKWGYAIERITLTEGDSRNQITVDLVPHYQDDATLDLGWSYESAEDNATTGRWNRIQPYLGYPNSDWVHPPAEPAGTAGKIFFTGKPPRFAPPEQDDVSKGRTTLTSPVMDMSNYGDPIVLFDLWLVQFERDSVIDSLVVELSNDNGGSWKQAYSEVKGKAGWKRHTMFLRDYIALTDQMRIRFRVSDTLGNILVVAGLDNFDVIDRIFSAAPDLPTVEADQSPLQFSLSPNPAHGSTELTLHSNGERIRGEIISPSGQTLVLPFDRYIPKGEHHINLPLTLTPGWYILRIAGEHGSHAEKIVVE